MGRIIYTTRDDVYRDFGREMRGTTDNMQSALCLDVMGGRYVDTELWQHPLRCDKAEVRRDCEFRFGGIDKRPLYMPDGQALEGWSLGMNSLLAVSSEPIKLLARIHGQCELHCWMREESREWFIDCLDELADVGVLHREYRMPLFEWLRKARGPVVMSYSVCDEFPYPHMLDEFRGDGCSYEAFEKSGHTQEWLFDACLAKVQEEPSLELSEEITAELRFAHRKTIWDVRAAWREHLDAAKAA